MRRTMTRRGAWALAALVGVAALTVIAVLSSAPDRLLDPDSRGPTGGRALAQVLRDHGVTVEVSRTVAEVEDAAPDEGTTVLVSDPAYLSSSSARALARAVDDARLVVLNPTTAELASLGIPLAALPGAGEGSLDAGCQDPVVQDGDTLGRGDVALAPRDEEVPDGATPCFVLGAGEDGGGGQGGGEEGSAATEFGEGAYLVSLDGAADGAGGPRETVVVGFGSALTNRYVDDRAHAGLGIRILGVDDRLVWFQPGVSELAEEDGAAAAPSPWPDWLGPGAAVLALTVVVLALVLGRRLGRLVSEPLPVVVRAVETTESRGRLYRRANDTGRAAAVLRGGTRARLARRLAVDPRDRDGLVAAASRASGTPVQDVHALLHGPDPVGDRDLVSLATSLTDLEERADPR